MSQNNLPRFIGINGFSRGKGRLSSYFKSLDAAMVATAAIIPTSVTYMMHSTTNIVQTFSDNLQLSLIFMCMGAMGQEVALANINPTQHGNISVYDIDRTGSTEHLPINNSQMIKNARYYGNNNKMALGLIILGSGMNVAMSPEQSQAYLIANLLLLLPIGKRLFSAARTCDHIASGRYTFSSNASLSVSAPQQP